EGPLAAADVDDPRTSSCSIAGLDASRRTSPHEYGASASCCALPRANQAPCRPHMPWRRSWRASSVRAAPSNERIEPANDNDPYIGSAHGVGAWLLLCYALTMRDAL